MKSTLLAHLHRNGPHENDCTSAFYTEERCDRCRNAAVGRVAVAADLNDAAS